MGGLSCVYDSVMQRATKTKVLGIYLIVLSLYQIVLLTTWPGGAPLLLDPRGGILALGRYQPWSFWVDRATAGWLLTMGLAISTRGRLVKAYVVSELCMASPSFFVGLLAAAASLRFAGILSAILFGSFVLFVFTLVPLSLAIHILLQQRHLRERS